MNVWSNISISPQDPEIISINKLEVSLGKLSDCVYKIRELITRFEICHFKYQQHIKKIKYSIIHLQPDVTPNIIGIHHIQHGENAWKNDVTGKSLLGQQYVWAIKNWLNDIHPTQIPDKHDKKLGIKVRKWLGGRLADKVRLVQLLLARLTWDWARYEELQHGGEYKELELQICRMDICHYAFPANLDRLLKGIGKMSPIENFEGCGSFDYNIRKSVIKELVVLIDLFKSFYSNKKSDKKSQIKGWLIACLIKTLKEQVDLSEPTIDI